jgi:hypothetical protein
VAVTLEDARNKLRWAKNHFGTLRPQIETFEQRDAHTFSYEFDPDKGEYTFYVHGLERPDPEWGLIIGDCLHNARTALDYLLVRLVAYVTGEDPKEIKRVSFPIFDEESEFASKVGSLRKNVVLKHYVTRIEELQPFNQANPAIWGLKDFGLPVYSLVPAALSRLSALDNIDKHRIVHAAWVGGAFHAHGFPDQPTEFTSQGSGQAMGPFEDGARVGHITFMTPVPFEWHPTPTAMKRHFPLQVSFADPLPVSGVLEVLPLCLWAVEVVLDMFEPVFSQGQPPLPATAALAAEDRYYSDVLRHLAQLGFDVPEPTPAS